MGLTLPEFIMARPQPYYSYGNMIYPQWPFYPDVDESSYYNADLIHHFKNYVDRMMAHMMIANYMIIANSRGGTLQAPINCYKGYAYDKKFKRCVRIVGRG